MLVAASALLLSPAAFARPAPAPAAPQMQLRGLTADEAKALIAKIATHKQR